MTNWTLKPAYLLQAGDTVQGVGKLARVALNHRKVLAVACTGGGTEFSARQQVRVLSKEQALQDLIERKFR